jgi:hypothetical protein
MDHMEWYQASHKHFQTDRQGNKAAFRTSNSMSRHLEESSTGAINAIIVPYSDYNIVTQYSDYRSRKLRLTTVGDPPRWPRDTPLTTKVGTKFRQQVAVATEFNIVTMDGGCLCNCIYWIQTNSTLLVCKRTTPTELLPLVGKVSVNFWG